MGVVRLHYAWKYPFLRPPNTEIVDCRYNKKHHATLHAMLARQAAAATSTELPSAQSPSAQFPAPQEGSPALATESLRGSGGMDHEMVEREEAVEAATDAAAQ